MLSDVPPLFRKHRGRALNKPAPTPPGPAALTLVSASFNPDNPSIVLIFDRAISIDAIAPDQFEVDDGLFTASHYVGDGDGAGGGGATMTLIMDVAGAASGGQVRLSVTAANGIVAVDDGGTWAGVTDLELPFP